MQKEWKYRSTIKTRPFFYLETKKMAELLLQELDEAQLRQIVIQENLFQMKTENRRKEVANTILRRLELLDAFLLQQIAHGDTATSKLLVLYSILKTDRLFYEFMNEVFREKVSVLDMKLTNRDFSTFFENKRQQSETVASWKDYTFYKLQQVYIRILFEAGLLKTQKEPREMLNGMINMKVKEHLLMHGEQIYVEILTGERR
ncbi:DUF1819 domain-containing protein [Pueribacillus theae]|uniref:DUF1819 domain-containing protein n=1 Tax=Pueribacillus theae TaxID=2171751 RepID=A0A2U1JZ18_9BACI|nr:DUF1819 family protein [Pueribacillus theae]PWA10013.1 DUF1819 domain-containing protein [Pueribacillus theae]